MLEQLKAYFGFDRFLPLQEEIITEVLAKRDTLVLMPTGGGKSLCYQLPALRFKGLTLVVSPLIALMKDQVDGLLANGVPAGLLNSTLAAQEANQVQDQARQGKIKILYVAPERLALPSFQRFLQSLDVSLIAIDEAHCISEWGHDFRTSYLNLASTIDRFCKNFKYIGLTATASTNVLKDIQVEFGIEQDNVKTPSDYTREELEFSVIDDKHNKFDALQKELSILKSDIGILNTDGNNTKCGIIFTPTVNGPKGCYKLSQELSNNFEEDVRYYSGSVPKIAQRPVMSSEQFNEYKLKVQNDFKNNEFSLLAATKAFGMGINKGNIFYTFHYGIPGSMESLLFL